MALFVENVFINFLYLDIIHPSLLGLDHDVQKIRAPSISLLLINILIDNLA